MKIYTETYNIYDDILPCQRECKHVMGTKIRCIGIYILCIFIVILIILASL
jgi:hypothetical protein